MTGKPRFRLTPLMVGSISAIFSALALVATTITTWISWNARDDYVESVALGEAVGRCAEAVATAGDYHSALSAVAADFGAMTADNRAEIQSRIGDNLRMATELGNDLDAQLVWLDLVYAMRFAAENTAFAAVSRTGFDLFTEFNGTIQIATDPASLPAALDPVLARIGEIGPDLYGLCVDLATRR